MSVASFDENTTAEAVARLLDTLNIDCNNPGLRDTPHRVARAFHELLAGYEEDPIQHLEVQFVDPQHQGVVCVRDIAFSSLCEHHLLPFFGKAHIAYLPSHEGKITGLSKLARLTDGYARRLQVQERLGNQIADGLVQVLQPQAVLVVLEAEHTCMTVRGAKKPGAYTTTIAARGLWIEPVSQAPILNMLLAQRS